MFSGESSILVTGAKGLIGRKLVEKLLLDKVKYIYVTSREVCKLKEYKKQIWDNDDRIICIEWDGKSMMPEEINDVDYIFHAAGPVGGRIIRDNPVDVINANIMGTISCLELIKKQGYGKFVALSSATVYGPVTDHKDLIVYENDTNNSYSIDDAISSYADSKRMIEVLVKSYYTQFGVFGIVARIGYVLGGSADNCSTAIDSFLRCVKENNDIVLNNNIFEKRDYIFIDDVVNGLCTIAKSGMSGESYNISSDGKGELFCTLYDIARCLVDKSREFGVNIKLVSENTILKKPGIRMKNDKLRAMGWNNKYTLDDALCILLTENLNR